MLLVLVVHLLNLALERGDDERWRSTPVLENWSDEE